MKICFLENTKFEYSYKDVHSSKLRGAENILINIAQHLTLLGHNVTVYNNCDIGTHKENSNWFNINQINKKSNTTFDLAISNGDTRLLKKVFAKKYIVFSYSLQSIEKFLRKGQLYSYLKYRPTYFLIGDYHKKNRSKLISLFGVQILKLGIDDKFLNANIPSDIKDYYIEPFEKVALESNLSIIPYKKNSCVREFINHIKKYVLRFDQVQRIRVMRKLGFF